MFPLRSQPTHGPALNAIAPPPAHSPSRARHLRQCERLAELGMELAEAAHREALRDLAAPVEHRLPGMAAPPLCAEPTPGRLFTQLSRSVRQAILLEARLEAGVYDRPPAAPAARPTPHEAANPVPSHASRAHPASPAADRPEQVEDDLAGDLKRSVIEILADIRREIDAALDAGRPAAQQAAPTAEPPTHPPQRTALERSAELAERTRPRPAPA